MYYILTETNLVGVECQPKKASADRSAREKSPGVSFAESNEYVDFQERQYQTVHAGQDSFLLLLLFIM